MSRTANDSQIMKKIKTFYANLYTSSHKATNKTFLEFTKNIDLQIPKLSEEENNECEDKLTLEECRLALKSMGNGENHQEMMVLLSNFISVSLSS